MPVNSCPKCGAMVVPQLVRCRQCKTFLQGTGVEGFLLENIIPKGAERAPATSTLVFALCVYYALMVAAAGNGSALGFSGYTLQVLGATHGPSILRGEWWRLATSIFAHHDLIHLALNLSSLVFVGELVERIFDRKKMILIYLASGVGSMFVSHLYYVHVRGQVLVVSAGASGAICGLIGAALFGARKLGPEHAETVSRMKRWAAFMVVLGFAFPGINNAAHFGGFLIGAALARLTPVGVTKTLDHHKVLSVVLFGAVAGLAACFGLMVEQARGYPKSLEDDEDARAILGFVYSPGHERAYSSQKRIQDSCYATQGAEVALESAHERCELSVRANPEDRASYLILADIMDREGAHDDARRLREIAKRL